MKKLTLVFSLIFIFSLMISAQDKTAILAEYQDITEVFIQEDTKSTTNFTVNCSTEEIDRMTEETNKYGDYLTFITNKKESEKESYNCTLSFSHNAQPMEFFKILSSMGFTGVKIAEKDFPLDHLLSIK